MKHRAVTIGVCVALFALSPFVGLFVGRASYLAFVWASRVAGFTPSSDPSLQAEAMGGVMFGILASAGVLACAALVANSLQKAQADG